MLNHQKRFFSTVIYRLMVKRFIYDLSHEAVKKNSWLYDHTQKIDAQTFLRWPLELHSWVSHS